MSKTGQIQALVRNGLYYLTEHADDEAGIDGFDIYDVEHGILIGIVCRITATVKVRVITVYEDKPKGK